MRRQVRQGESAGSAIRRCRPSLSLPGSACQGNEGSTPAARRLRGCVSRGAAPGRPVCVQGERPTEPSTPRRSAPTPPWRFQSRAAAGREPALEGGLEVLGADAVTGVWGRLGMRMGRRCGEHPARTQRKSFPPSALEREKGQSWTTSDSIWSSGSSGPVRRNRSSRDSRRTSAFRAKRERPPSTPTHPLREGSRPAIGHSNARRRTLIGMGGPDSRR
jgi:hypothetical protein